MDATGSEAPTASAADQGRTSRFPVTRWSVIRRASNVDSPAYRVSLEHLARLYWRPVFGYLRRRWVLGEGEAMDIAQAFFAALCEKRFLGSLSPDRGRFRSYVMRCLDNFVRLEHRAAVRVKRGGRKVHVSIDSSRAWEPASRDCHEEAFRREWGRALLGDAVAEMEELYRNSGKEKAYRLFVQRDLHPSSDEDVSYEALARKFEMSLSEVSTSLHRARKFLRELILKRIRDTVGSDAEVAEEMEYLFGGGRS